MTAVMQSMPEVEVSREGAPFDDSIMACLVQMQVVQNMNAPASCELEFSDSEGRICSSIAIGAKIAVRVGQERKPVFEGYVAVVELRACSEVRTTHVLAFDALEKLRRGAPVRVHSNVSFADLATELTKPIGVLVDMAESGPLLPRLIQHRRNDLDVMLEAAERAGVCVRLEGMHLRSFPIEPSAAAKSLELGVEIREASITLSDADAAGTVQVSGWDPHEVRAYSGSAQGTGSAPEVKLTNVIVHSDAQADVFARSQASRRSVSAAVLTAVAEGDPSLTVGLCVRVRGLPAAFSGPFRITRARHIFSTRLGYVVEISSHLTRPHTPAQGATATLGVVADVRDPQALGRVKVRYPALADAQSDWLQVLAAGAGGHKGMVALPSIDDNVLVLGFDDDPAHGIVLGALYGAGGLPGDQQKPLRGYGIYSPGGHSIELNDEGALLLRTAGGTFLELGVKKSTLHVGSDLRIEAPGQTVSIGAKSVEIERA